VSREVEPITIFRELRPAVDELGEEARNDDGFWLPHHFIGSHSKKGARCGACGGPYVNYITQGWLSQKPNARAPMIHHAYPQSVNETGPGDNYNIYLQKKEAWEYIFGDMVSAADLPMPLTRVLVEGEWTFGRLYPKGPDQENYRYHCSKFLGDALQKTGHLVNDAWWQFEFGNATYRMERGVVRLVLTVFAVL